MTEETTRKARTLKPKVFEVVNATTGITTYTRAFRAPDAKAHAVEAITGAITVRELSADELLQAASAGIVKDVADLTVK